MSQKARLKWAAEGGDNTKYFHSCIRRNLNKTKICGLSDCIWQESPTLINEEIFRFYKKSFQNAKILAIRLKRVIPQLVSQEHGTFIKGHYIVDGILVANDIIIEELKIRKCKSLVFKEDFAKAFDSLNWEYILGVLKVMGFGDRWIFWIGSCIKSASVSILINGSPTKEFVLKRGVSTGDFPLMYLGLSIGNKVTKLKDCELYIDKVHGWETILSSYARGGLNVGSLKAKNLALMAKT
ncbi:uncharacterized protein [Rutidosis leptorrhynchoides]|uniref:uncharacterized protein n=1 Tax=Rutidosis leptorrhynchoides TaxID=125765 RepID=UPI003A98FFF3